jgi:FkbM family methyltransferase
MKIHSLLARLTPVEVARHYQSDQLVSFLLENPDSAEIVTFEGSVFFARLDNKIERALIKGGGRYDQANLSLIKRLVHKGSTCFDIGANIGVYSVLMARLAEGDGQVHSFEPVPHIANKLKLNVGLNGQSWVRVNTFALGDAVETRVMQQIRPSEFRGGTSTFVQNENIEALGRDRFDDVEVPIRTLDAYVEDMNISRIDFIKIDVEGYELNVIKGGMRAIVGCRPSILMEFDIGRHGHLAEDFSGYFRQADYQVFEFRMFGARMVVKPFDFSVQPEGRNILCLPRS